MKRKYFGERFLPPAVLDNEDFFVLVLWDDDTRVEVPFNLRRYDHVNALRDRDNLRRRGKDE